MIKKVIFIVLGLLIVGGGVLFAINGKDTYEADKYSANLSDSLQIGSIVSFTLPDQFNKSHTSNKELKTIILSFTKATGHLVKKYLTEQDVDYLPKRNAFFVADISPMPVVIRNTFALPDLKKSSFSVLLIYDKKIATKFKNEEKIDKIAVISLENGVIKEIKYISTKEELKVVLN